MVGAQHGDTLIESRLLKTNKSSGSFIEMSLKNSIIELQIHPSCIWITFGRLIAKA